MTEEELRGLVRGAVERHLAAAGPVPGVMPGPPAPPLSHPSFARYAIPAGRDADGPCLIEPAVRCNHCGYCQSHGF